MLNDRDQIRQTYTTAWQKKKDNKPLTELEAQLVELILHHPEYQAFLDNAAGNLQQDYRTDNNPFLHLSLHHSLREQLATNRPTGIRQIFDRLTQKHQDQHQVEHLMMDVMAAVLWEAQQNNTLPDETQYLEKLRRL